MKDITHVERSRLPWRSEAATECGLDASRHPTWTREQVIAKAKELGTQRLSMLVCMTCWHTFQNHSTWDEDPASCMVRHATSMTTRWGTDADGEKRKFADELRAIAMLIEAHRTEFDATIQSFGEVVSLKDHRARKRATS